jgi:hypothetical protein
VGTAADLEPALSQRSAPKGLSGPVQLDGIPTPNALIDPRSSARICGEEEEVDVPEKPRKKLQPSRS